jgi:hypothetical protein
MTDSFTELYKEQLGETFTFKNLKYEKKNSKNLKSLSVGVESTQMCTGIV